MEHKHLGHHFALIEERIDELVKAIEEINDSKETYAVREALIATRQAQCAVDLKRIIVRCRHGA